jgi:hypothetical protein
MIEVSTNKFGGRWRKVDIEDVWLDGRNAKEMNQWQLFAELQKLGVPHITKDTAKSDLIFLLGVFQQDEREKARGYKL